MNLRFVIKILSLLLLIIVLFMIIPAAIAFFKGESRALSAFLTTISVTAAIAGTALIILRNDRVSALSTRDSYLVVTLGWVFGVFVGAVPFMLSGTIPSLADAYFESMSGFTTTGASILSDVEILPASILFWRSLTHWLGGMGIVVMAVAILPLLGIGGMSLVKAEMPGPTLDKLSPRIGKTAMYLWVVYLVFTVAETILLMFGGMDLFDSLTHTFGSVATGGFSTKNLSVGHFHSAYCDWVITIFMVLCGMNYALHFKALTGDIKTMWKDIEAKVYLAIFAIASIIIAINLYLKNIYTTVNDSLRYAAFQAASIMTTTGYATADFEKWPYLAQGVLFLLMWIGGCSGSTAGGIKVIRYLTLFKQSYNEMRYLLHPRGVFSLSVGGNTVRKDIAYSVAGFFFLYVLIIMTVALVVTSSGQDITTSITASLATTGNIGPGLGNVGPMDNYGFFPDYVKWTLSFAMLVGRLELYTVLVLGTALFWRR